MTEKEDPRITRTRESIRNSFKDMICRMDYEKITVKELTELAGINRKTFYLHYSSLDELLQEMQKKMVEDFIKRTADLNRPRDLDKITREFFLNSEDVGKLGERLICNDNYHYINQRIVGETMSRAWESDSLGTDNEYVRNIIMTYVSESTLAIYKQWVLDGRKIPIEDIITIAARLICEGINGLSESHHQ